MPSHKCDKEGVLREISTALGRIEQKLDDSLKSQDEHKERLQKVEKIVDSHDKSISFVKWLCCGFITIASIVGSYLSFFKK